jgi:DNA-binding NarL/FixJ family response regulator
MFYYYAINSDNRHMIDDESNWKDKGCEFFPSCLNCPFPVCIEDEPRGRQKMRKRDRESRIAALRSEGKSVSEIADMFNLSRRSVYRALALNRPEVKQQYG